MDKVHFTPTAGVYFGIHGDETEYRMRRTITVLQSTEDGESYEIEEYDPSFVTVPKKPGKHYVCSTEGCEPGTGKWVSTDNKVWVRMMKESDKTMPRYIEDIWDTIGIDSAPTYVKEVYNKKKELRAGRPS